MTAEEADARPTVKGNSDVSLNRNPRLEPPNRKHGNVRDLFKVWGLEKVKAILFLVTFLMSQHCVHLALALIIVCKVCGIEILLKWPEYIPDSLEPLAWCVLLLLCSEQIYDWWYSSNTPP